MRELRARPRIQRCRSSASVLLEAAFMPLSPCLARAPDHVLSSLIDRQTQCLQETERTRGACREHEGCALAWWMLVFVRWCLGVERDKGKSTAACTGDSLTPRRAPDARVSTSRVNRNCTLTHCYPLWQRVAVPRPRLRRCSPSPRNPAPAIG